MHAIDIKYNLAKNNLSSADIARRLNVTNTSVSQVIHGRRPSRRVSQAIADAIGMPLEEVFTKYAQKKAPSSGHNTAVAVGTTTTVPEDGHLLQADG